MLEIYNGLKGLLRSERGQDMVEYALIVVIISVVIVLATIVILPGAFATWAGGVRDCVTTPGSCPF